MRILGIDHGQVRIGLALSDPTGMLASPFMTLERKRRRKQDLKAIAEIAREQEAEAMVIGIPLDMSGETGKKAKEVHQFADALREITSLPVYEWDERLTTVAADRALNDMEVKGSRRKELVDQMAAAIILQGYLDSNRTSDPYEEPYE
jgi:putative Holliday junction resolvase